MLTHNLVPSMYSLPFFAAIGNPDLGKKLLDGLLRRYAEHWRAYHTIDHIFMMLDGFEEVMHLLTDPRAVLLAIWYHDAVYFPRLSNNEEQSLKLAAQDLFRAGCDAAFIKKVCDHIRASDHREGEEDPDTQVFLDLDLAILGKDESTFDRYDRAIRQEYIFVEDEDYYKGRLQVLERFLRRKPLYYTPFLREKYEKQAKQNLKRAIQNLS